MTYKEILKAMRGGAKVYMNPCFGSNWVQVVKSDLIAEIIKPRMAEGIEAPQTTTGETQEIQCR